MKNFLFILGLLISFMLFAPEEGTKSMDEVMSATKEAVMKEKNTALQDMRLRGVNQLHRVSQHISTYQIINLSTLLCRMGEHVFALRKLII